MKSNFISQEYLDFIPKIYDTMVNPDGWSDVLEELSRHCGSRAASLMFGDNVYPEISHRILSTNIPVLINEEEMQQYNERFGKEEAEALVVVSQRPVLTWVSDEVAFGKPADEIPCTVYQREYWGIDRRVAVRLNETPIWFDGISLNYELGRGNMSEDEAAISQIFLPHFAKTLEINRPFALLQRRFQAILSVLDHLKIGVVIVNRHGDILIKNQEAENALIADNGLALSRDQKINLRSPEQMAALNARILDASNMQQPTKSDTIMTVNKRDDSLPWILEIIPLSNLSGDMEASFQGAAIFITDPDREDVISTKGMEALFNLTPAESEVCALLTRGMKIEDVAESRNVSTATVRSQVKDLFSKTNSNSQIDLVRLALKVNLPVDHPDEHKKNALIIQKPHFRPPIWGMRPA